MQSIYEPSTISSLSCLRKNFTFGFGIEELDKFFGDLKPGNFVVLYGSFACHELSELLCVQYQIQSPKRTSSSVIFIDGGNLFDPYFISENARLHGLEAEQSLQNIWISRAFTGYQMASLITGKLDSIIEQKRPSIVVISDIAALFCDSNIGINEAKTIFNRSILLLWKLVKKRNIVLVATSVLSKNKRKESLEQYLLGRADIVAKISTENSHLNFELEKHPNLPISSLQLYSKTNPQCELEDFLEV